MATQILESRIAAAQQLMTERGIDFLFVAPSSDLIYLLDYPAHASERLALLVIPSSGRAHVVVPELEVSRAADKAALVEIHTWTETERPTEIVRELVGRRTQPTIGVSDQMWSVFLVQLLDVLPGARFRSASEVIRHLRMTKDATELEHLRQAAALADRAWDEFIATATLAGKTERQAASELAELRRKHGLEVPNIGICASGPHSAAPHHITGDRVIQQGDVVVFDFGGAYNHYRADVTRSVYVGEPHEEYRAVYDIVLQANEAALAAVQAGVACQEIDRAARRVIAEAGYGQYFIHRVGHGVGLDGHEEPYLVEGNTLPLAEGMVFSDEPGIYLPGRFGVRIEDSVVLTARGGERINHCRRELTVMP